ILAGATTAVFNRVRRKCPHVIFCSGSADPARSPVVALDDEAAGAMAAQHLMDRRLEHFGFYGTSPNAQNVANKRYNGFRKELEQHGYSCDAAPVHWP